MSEPSRFDALMAVNKRPPIAMVSGHGSWLVDENGKRYLDFGQGWAVNSLGHSPAVVAEAIAAQSRKLLNVGPAFYTQPATELATLIADGRALNRVFFTNCGAEANEGAIKLVRKWGGLHRGGAFEIITMVHSFHGRTLATMSASGKAVWNTLFEPKVPGFVKVPMNDIAAVERAIGDRTAAVMLELVQGEGGVNPADEAYVKDLRRLADEKRILLVIDEVQTGMGRTGKLFAYEHFGITPDIMTLGKGIAGGVPLGALVARDAVSCFEPGDQGGTFNGGALATAAGAAVFRVVSDPAFLAEVNRTGEYLAERLRALRAPDGSFVRGRGLMLALVLPADGAADIVARAFEQGLVLHAPRPHVLRFTPALNVSRAEVDQMVEILGPLLAA
ncbi:MAG TPA: acetylornithine transaminase [Polyangiaceae bacterium]|nr:acetylornithine transaminase [Polyangiaceae bacterium]